MGEHISTCWGRESRTFACAVDMSWRPERTDHFDTTTMIPALRGYFYELARKGFYRRGRSGKGCFTLLGIFLSYSLFFFLSLSSSFSFFLFFLFFFIFFSHIRTHSPLSVLPFFLREGAMWFLLVIEVYGNLGGFHY
ncbi:uncharacterized protein P884DRAFT_113926 [Thermothelomyces heterothallicus CBS 202.75]|uniref:uncharacterized protein n=1 Tax=Thermothelomyces heterothallicus CBS 202.75 TaxID=1149848 RepID=UPI003743F460